MIISRKLKINLAVWLCIAVYVLFFGSYLSIESYHPLKSVTVRFFILIIIAMIWFLLLVLLALKQNTCCNHIGKRFINLPNRFKRIILSIIALFLILLTLAWSTGFNSATKYTTNIKQHFVEYNASVKQKEQIDTIGINLQALMILRQAAQIRELSYSNWWLHLGFTFPNVVSKKINETYNDQLRNTFQSFVLSNIQSVIKKYVNQDWKHSNQYDTLLEKAHLYQWLSSYLMFNQIKYMNKSQIKILMLDHWQKSLSEKPENIEKLQLLLADLLDLQLSPNTNLNQKLIDNARKILGNDGPIIKSYLTLKTQVSMKNTSSLNLGGNAASRVFKTNQDIPFLYTKSGWYNFIRDNILKSIYQAASQQWVFGSTEKSSFSQRNIRTITTGVTSLYWRDYGQIWQQQFNSLQLKHFDNIQQAISLTKLLSTPKSPFLVSIKQLSDNFDQNNTNGYPSYIAQIKVFSNNPPLIKELINHIKELHEHLIVIQTANNEKEQAYQMAKLIIEGKSTPLSSIIKIAKKSPPPIQNWLNDLTNNTTQAIFNLAQGYIVQEWHQLINPICLHNFNNISPFKPNSNNDLPLDKFTAFFGNDKTIMNFMNNYALPFMFIKAKTNHIKFIPIFEPHSNLSQQIFNTIITAYEINRLLFSSNNKNQPSLELSLTPRYLSQNLSQIEIHYNNSSFIYNNGPIFETNLSWPAKVNNNIIVTYTDINGAKYSNSYYGPWGLIKLLQSSEFISKTKDHFQISFSHGDKKAYFYLKISGSGYFPSIYDFKNFKCEH